MHAALEDEVGPVLRLELLLDVLEVVLAGGAPPLGWNQAERGLRRLLGHRRRERADVHHTGEHGGPAPLGRLRVVEGRVGRGCLRQAGQERALGQAQLRDRLAEEGAGGRLHAKGAVAEVDLVQVHLEDAVLRVAPLELEGEHRLLELALEALVRGEEEDLGELLGDGAAALHDAPAPEVLVDRARDAGRVHSVVGVEARVLGGDDGVAQGLGDLRERHEDAALDVELGDELVVVVVDLRALARVEGLELGDRGQGSGEDREDPEGGGGHAQAADEDDAPGPP